MDWMVIVWGYCIYVMLDDVVFDKGWMFLFFVVFEWFFVEFVSINVFIEMYFFSVNEGEFQ